MTIALFWIFAVGAVVTGLLVFRLDSMARVTFALLASFLFVAAEWCCWASATSAS